ncbi:MAG: hypothetical protein ABFD46_12490 [Armatimonadota bacterium]
MIDTEPTIAINTLSSYPLVTLKGTVTTWHGLALDDVIDNCITEGAGSVTLDITQASFPEAESLSTLIRTLRISCRYAHIAVVAGDRTAAILSSAKLGSNVDILATLDEAFDIPRPIPEYLTSRRITQTAEKLELPMAA